MAMMDAYITELARRVVRALERAGEWGYSSTLRDAIHHGELKEVREDLSYCVDPLREHAQQFDLADEVEEALA